MIQKDVVEQILVLQRFEILRRKRKKKSIFECKQKEQLHLDRFLYTKQMNVRCPWARVENS